MSPFPVRPATTAIFPISGVDVKLVQSHETPSRPEQATLNPGTAFQLANQPTIDLFEMNNLLIINLVDQLQGLYLKRNTLTEKIIKMQNLAANISSESPIISKMMLMLKHIDRFITQTHEQMQLLLDIECFDLRERDRANGQQSTSEPTNDSLQNCLSSDKNPAEDSKTVKEEVIESQKGDQDQPNEKEVVESILEREEPLQFIDSPIQVPPQHRIYNPRFPSRQDRRRKELWWDYVGQEREYYC